MHIDHLLHSASEHANSPDSLFTVSKEWSQGRTIYGGLSAGMLYSAAKSHVAASRKMRSMTTNFVGPLAYDVPFNITVEIVREGKNISQIMARAIQEGKNCVVAQICFAEPRASKVHVVNNDQHQMELPNKAKYIPQIPKVTPKFLKNIDLSIMQGGVPFTGKKTSHYQGWMRFKHTPEQFTDAHIVSIIDAWPPTLLQMMRWPAPASTVSWNLEFIHPHNDIAPNAWLAYQAHTRQASDGYGHTEANIWDDRNNLIAVSRQTVAIFD